MYVGIKKKFRARVAVYMLSGLPPGGFICTAGELPRKETMMSIEEEFVVVIHSKRRKYDFYD